MIDSKDWTCFVCLTTMVWDLRALNNRNQIAIIKELWRISCNKQDCTRQQHLPGHWAAEIDQWKQKFNPINSSEAAKKMSAL